MLLPCLSAPESFCTAIAGTIVTPNVSKAEGCNNHGDAYKLVTMGQILGFLGNSPLDWRTVNWRGWSGETIIRACFC